MTERLCKTCNAPLPPSKGKGRPRVYCSLLCSNSAGSHSRNRERAYRYELMVSAGANPKEADYHRSRSSWRAFLDGLLAKKAPQASAPSAVHQDMNANNTQTLVPASYPALESEVYHSLDFVTERATLVPESGEAEELVAESVRVQ